MRLHLRGLRVESFRKLKTLNQEEKDCFWVKKTRLFLSEQLRFNSSRDSNPYTPQIETIVRRVSTCQTTNSMVLRPLIYPDSH